MTRLARSGAITVRVRRGDEMGMLYSYDEFDGYL
jgi:hypothetical protein